MKEKQNKKTKVIRTLRNQEYGKTWGDMDKPAAGKDYVRLNATNQCNEQVHRELLHELLLG